MMRFTGEKGSRLAAALAATVLLSFVACSTSNAATRTAAPAGSRGGVVAQPPPAVASPAPVQTPIAVSQQPSGSAAVSQTAAGVPVIAFTDGSGNRVEMEVEVADTEVEREIGLMNRASMPDDHGMIFVWPSAVDNRTVAFWMKDTEIPLSIAFIDANGIVVSVDEMQAESTDLHYAAAPYQYAVEANAGWFAAHDVNAGSQVDLSQVQQIESGPQQ